MPVYDNMFYASQEDRSALSAGAIVPHLLNLLQPKTVLDVGCGRGTWAEVFGQHGCDSFGLDGPWAEANTRIPGRLITFDFAAAAMPFAPELPFQRFDLVTTFEFLEHVERARAKELVRFLTSLTDVVVAGAAPPGQGGTYHVNEQWPSYWRELFAAEGFVAYDCVRPVFWDHPEVEPWYVQNTIGYFRGEVPRQVVEQTERAACARLRVPIDAIHPGVFATAIDPAYKSFRVQADGLRRNLARRAGRVLQRVTGA